MLRFASKKKNDDEDDFSLSGLTKNTFLPNCVILDDEPLSTIASILESENRDLVDYKKSTSANTSHAEWTYQRRRVKENERKPNPVKHQT